MSDAFVDASHRTLGDLHLTSFKRVETGPGEGCYVADLTAGRSAVVITIPLADVNGRSAGFVLDYLNAVLQNAIETLKQQMAGILK